MSLCRILKKTPFGYLSLLALLLLTGCQAHWSNGFYIQRRVNVQGRAVDVFYQDTKLYAALEENDHIKLQIFDATSPKNPQKLGKLDLGQGKLVATKFVEGSLFVRDNLACIAAVEPGQLVVVDVTNPKAGLLKSKFQTKGDATDVWVTKEKIAFVTSWSGTCHIIDLKDASEPKKIIDIPPPQGEYGDGKILPEKYATSVWVEEQTAYIVWWVHGRLMALDISDIENPETLGQYQTTKDKPMGGWAYRVLVSDNRAYLSADQYSKKVGGIHIVDITNPAELKRIGFFSAKGYGKPEPVPRKFTRNLALIEDFLFVSDHKFGIVCLDVSEPANIKLIEELKLSDARGLCAVEDVIYAAAGERGILILSARAK